MDITPELLSDIEQATLYITIFIFVVWIIFANTVRKTLKIINEQNRLMLPSQAWFLAVPLFNMYWNFEVVRRLSFSFNNEFFDRKIAVEEFPTKKAGQAYAWSFLIFNIPLLPVFVRVVALCIGIIYFSVYWYKIIQYKNLIEEHTLWENKQDKS